MDIDYFTCNTCGEEKVRLRLKRTKTCYGDKCCKCCQKQGLQSKTCKLASLEFDLLGQGKKLNENELKGVFLERAIDTTLNRLKVPHKSNPFKLYYSNYQAKNPDIIIEELNAIIECKNLSEKQVNFLSKQWLDKHIINRPRTAKYSLKIAMFSYKPRQTLIKYLKNGSDTYEGVLRE